MESLQANCIPDWFHDAKFGIWFRILVGYPHNARTHVDRLKGRQCRIENSLDGQRYAHEYPAISSCWIIPRVLSGPPTQPIAQMVAVKSSL
jgi:hypothetical protein